MEDISITFHVEITNWKKEQNVDLTFYLNNKIICERKQVNGYQKICVEHVELEDNTEYMLSMYISGLDSSYTEVDKDGNIVNDVLVVVKNIEIDEIPIDNLCYKNSVYCPEYPEWVKGNDTINCETHLGWNGTWSICITSPIYLWLLEHM